MRKQRGINTFSRQIVRRELRKTGMKRPGAYLHHALRGQDRKRTLQSLYVAAYMARRMPWLASHIMQSNLELAS